MKKKIVSYIGFIFVVAILGASCKVTNVYKQPVINTDSLFRDVSTTDTTTIADLHWNDFFRDTILKTLIAEGINNNPNLQIAFTRIQQSQAYYLQSRAAFLPTLNANVGVTTSTFSKTQANGLPNATQYQLGISSSWETDIWGKLSSSKRANLANLLQTQSAARAIQTNLVASIANYYYSLLALDQQLAITQQTVNNWDTTVQTMQALKEAAVVTEAAVVQSEAQRYAAEVTIPDLQQNIKENENALSILLGHAPSRIIRGTIDNQPIIPLLETGVPAQLLSNRPDVMEAEQNFRYYFELTNVARSYFYPSLVITGSAGVNALSVSNLFRPGALAASIGAGLAEPIFNQRANKTRLEVAKSQQQGALLNFQNVLLNAGLEVSNAMSLYQKAIDKISIRANQMTALQKSVEYTQELLQNGFANYTEIITARQSLLQAQLGSVNDRLQQLQASVNLYTSLGGGWK
jgi:outer membrane protein, multidrug efflux system